MAGIYIHIPFCRKACHYCNFHFSTSYQKREELITALTREIELQRDYLDSLPIETVYFGGGTPSSLPPSDIGILMETVRRNFHVDAEAEVTLEANPDDILKENLVLWKLYGINRLSIGVQAFQDHLLTAWNRSHLSAQAIQALRSAQDADIRNITADLIYGSPGLTDKMWESNIEQLVNMEIPHISCYALTVEKETALFYQIKQGKTKAPDDEQAARQYSMLQSILGARGYLQYEVSNFSKPGFESRHNRNYWTGEWYLGIGPSAHSYKADSRQWNVANNIQYIRKGEEGLVPFEMETLTSDQRYNEMVMTGLRTSQGISDYAITALGSGYQQHLHIQLAPYIRDKKIVKSETGYWVLDPSFYFFADGIAADLFI